MVSTKLQVEPSGTVLRNARALLIIQIANQLMPLALIPYLARVLGASSYGVVAFGLSIVAVASVVTDYGFNLSVTMQIAKRRDSKPYVNRLLGAVLIAKLMLVLAVVPAVLCYAAFTEKYAEFSSFFVLLLLPIFAQAFHPVWLFQGIEKMGYIAWFTLASRLAYMAMVFTFVSSPSDYTTLAVVNGISQFVALFLAMSFLANEGYRPRWASMRYVLLIMQSSTPFFWSRAAVSTYTAGGAMYLGFFSSSTQVAYYAAAEQLYKGAQGLFAPLSQALYPHMVRTKNFQLLFKVIKLSACVCLAGAVFGAFTGQYFIELLFGSDFLNSETALLVFLATLLVNTPSVLLGYPALGALGHAAAANRSVMIAGVTQLLLLVACFVFKWQLAYQIAMTVLVVEAVVLGLRASWFTKYYLVWSKSTCAGGIS